jgi:hypothetical protein
LPLKDRSRIIKANITAAWRLRVEWLPTNFEEMDFRFMAVVCGCIQAFCAGIYFIVF